MKITFFINKSFHCPAASLRHMHNKGKKLIYGVFILAVVIFAFQTIVIFTEKSEYRMHYHGNLTTELNVYTAGLNFTKHGFLKLHFLPVNREYKDTNDILIKDFYIHFSPGPDIVSGFLSKIRIRDFYAQKFTIIFISLLALFFYGLCAKIIFDNKRNKNISMTLFISIGLTSPWFIYWAGNLYYFTYWDLFASMGIWAVLTNRSKLFLFLCFASTLFTYEICPFLFIIGLFYALRQCRLKVWDIKDSLIFLLAVISACTFAFILRLGQNALLLGSVKLAVKDMLNAFLARTGVSATTELKNIYSFYNHITKMLYSLLWFYGISLLILAFAGFIRLLKENNIWIYAILMAGLIWHILFRQHSMLHSFTWRHIGVAIIILSINGFLWLYNNKYKLVKNIGIILLGFVLLRLPLGAEISKNNICLSFFNSAIKKTDSATLTDVLYDFRSSPEHRREKLIIINELAKRNVVEINQDSYEFYFKNKSFMLSKNPRNFSINKRNLPTEVRPSFSSTETQAYLPMPDSKLSMKEISDNNKLNKIKIDGEVNKYKSTLLKIYMRLI